METKRPTLTTQLRDGELEHVVVVAGEPVQAHTSRAAAMCALMLALALTGCESTKQLCADHPVACPVVIGLVGTALVMCAGPHGGHSQGKTQDVSTQPFTCDGSNCK